MTTTKKVKKATTVLEGKPQRVEHLKWKFELDKTMYDKVQADVEFVLRNAGGSSIGNMVEGDQLKLDYTLSIQYWGRVAEVLEAVLRIAQSGVVMNVDEHELRHGRCLIRKVFNAIDNIEAVRKQHVGWRAWLRKWWSR